GHAQELFLEERYTQGSFEHGFQRGMRVGDVFASQAAFEKWIDHLPDDWAGTNDGDLHDEVVEAYGSQAWQARHLRAALDLEHANGVGLLQYGVHAGVVCGKLGQVDIFTMLIMNYGDSVFEHGHHAEAQQIDFDDLHVGAIFFIPLHDDAIGHAGRLEWDDRIKPSLAHNQAAGVLSEMTRQILQCHTKLQELAD